MSRVHCPYVILMPIIPAIVSHVCLKLSNFFMPVFHFLELHAEKKLFLSRDPENPSSESILIHPAESVTEVVARIKANF